jgi:hypothetical protein
MLPLLKLISLRHLFDSPLRTALTVMGVAVGVATLVGISSINRSVTNAFRSTIDTVAGKADVSIAGTTAGLPEELLEKARAGAKACSTPRERLTVVAPVKDSPASRSTSWASTCSMTASSAPTKASTRRRQAERRSRIPQLDRSHAAVGERFASRRG